MGLSERDQVIATATDILGRIPRTRAIFAIDVHTDGPPTLSVAPLMDGTPELRDRFHGLLRQMADTLREALEVTP